MNRILTQPFGVDEKRKVAFDFAGQVPVGVTVSSALGQSLVYSGEDSAPDIVNGAAAISGTVVSQMVGGDTKKGTEGVIYELLMTATLSDGQIVPMATYVAFVPDLYGSVAGGGGGGGGSGGDAGEGFTMELNAGITLPSAIPDLTFVALEQEAGTLGETVVFGNILYLKTDGSWYKTNGNVVGTSGFVKLGVATAAGATSAVIYIMLRGKIRNDAIYPTFTIGASVYESVSTAGVPAQYSSLSASLTTDQVGRMIGFANTAHELDFRWSDDHVTRV